MPLFLLPFQCQMESGKGESCHPFCLPFTCMDDLLLGLKDLGIGCYWDGFFVGAVCYADDVALLAPSPSALHMMLHCCEDFAGSRGLIFNASKTLSLLQSYCLSL